LFGIAAQSFVTPVESSEGVMPGRVLTDAKTIAIPN